MMRSTVLRWLAAAALFAASGANAFAAQRQASLPCIPSADAEALFVYVLPDLVREVGNRCASALPASAYLRTGTGRLTARYADEGARTWPAARRALGALVGDENLAFLDSQFARPMVGALAGPLIAARVDVADCPVIDRALALVEPLPPRNTAALLVLFAQIDARAQNSRTRALNICPLPR